MQGRLMLNGVAGLATLAAISVSAPAAAVAFSSSTAGVLLTVESITGGDVRVFGSQDFAINLQEETGLANSELSFFADPDIINTLKIMHLSARNTTTASDLPFGQARSDVSAFGEMTLVNDSTSETAIVEFLAQAEADAFISLPAVEAGTAGPNDRESATATASFSLSGPGIDIVEAIFDDVADGVAAETTFGLRFQLELGPDEQAVYAGLVNAAGSADSSVVPAPPALPLLAGGLAILGWIARRRAA